jgi:hypothetical protein
LSQEKEKHGAGAFVLAGISFIPVIGVFAGMACILLAIIGRRSNSILLGGLGFSGIMCTVILYGVILPSVINSIDFSKSFELHAKSAMTSLVRQAEYFKLQHGHYPESLEELRSNLKDGEIVFSYDMSGPLGPDQEPREFYYEVVGDGENYILFGVGGDAEPFTSDDIYPLIDPVMDKNIGWVRQK